MDDDVDVFIGVGHADVVVVVVVAENVFLLKIVTMLLLF